MSDPTPPRREPPKITLPDWWTDTQAAFGPVLGGVGPRAIGESLDGWAALDEEERSGYLAILAYRQLFALAEVTVYLRVLEQRVSRATGTLKQHIDDAAASVVEAVVDAAAGAEEPEDEPPEVDEEPEDEPASALVEVVEPPPAPKPKPPPRRKPAAVQAEETPQ